jgi:hypothetical protein
LAYQDGGEFHEIYAAFVASAAVALLVLAGGALETQRVVAARAERCYVANFGFAFRALHGISLAGWGFWKACTVVQAGRKM